MSALNDFYGIAISIGDLQVTNWLALAALILLFLIFTLLASYRLARRIR